MHQKIRRMTQTAVLLALLIAIQAATRPAGQIVTGTCVNALLAIAALLCGTGCGLVVALLSPILAFLLGIAPQMLTVPAIMVGNCLYVVLLGCRRADSGIKRVAALIVASTAKFVALYALVTGLLCGVLADRLIEGGLLKEAACKTLPAMFSVRQLFTALLGGAVALLLVPIIQKALKK